MTDDETRRVYDAEATRYDEMTDAHNRTDPRLADFMAALPAGGAVLDLGCGPGAASEVMARAGFIVEATDASPAMVDLAAARDGVRAVLGGFDDITGQDVYDGVWANFSLLHAARDDMPRHLAAIRRALRAGGAFHIGLKTGTGARRDALGRFYTYYREDELTELLQEAGFTPRARHYGNDIGLDGSQAPWITVLSDG